MDRVAIQTYKVVVNHEGQYSIWPEHRENAAGWRNIGVAGTKQQCLSHIREVWTDMRPLSLQLMAARQPQNVSCSSPS